MGLFVNKPNGLRKSGVHFFTSLEPGQVKTIVRDKKLVRMITNTADKKFARIEPIDGPAYWELEDAEGFTEDPTADIWGPLQWWARIVYAQTGLVFTGIYPFQQVREYELERTNIKRDETVEKGDGSGKKSRAGSNLVLEVKRDISDHFRTREFLYPMHITAAETADKIPLDIIGVAEMAVVNPYKAAYGTDRWDQKVINLVSDAITSTTKMMRLDKILTSIDANGDPLPEDKREFIQKAVREIPDDATGCGIEILGFRILEINPVLDEEGLKATQAEAIALQKAKATRIDGEARADALRKLNEANVAGGEHSIATMEAEAFVRAAEAASKGGGSVLLMPNGRGGNTDPIQAAILAELQKLNKGT